MSVVNKVPVKKPLIEVQAFHNIRSKVTIAVSGGSDSLAALYFLSEKRDVSVIHVNHGDKGADIGEAITVAACEKLGVPYKTYKIDTAKPSGYSQEQWWREQRYQALCADPNEQVITVHQLDDCVEHWVWKSLCGYGQIIPYQYCNVIRPFRLVRRSTLKDYLFSQNLEWFEDPSNNDQSHMRNYIRHTLLPLCSNVNPGLHKTVKKKVMADENAKFNMMEEA